MEGDENLLGFFLQDKPAKILLVTQKNGRTYPADISKALAATYSHIVRVIQKLEEYGLIESEKQGRTKFIKLTERGEQVAHHLSGLEMALRRIGEEEKKNGRRAEKLEPGEGEKKEK
jgi:DNA-binding MarR family transcriptional regulator